MKKLRILALMHVDLVPPEDVKGHDLTTVSWRTEYDVMKTLRALGHEVFPVGVYDDLGAIREAIVSYQPDIAFNLLEEFASQGTYDQNVVSYLELLGLPYAAQEPRGGEPAVERARGQSSRNLRQVP